MAHNFKFAHIPSSKMEFLLLYLISPMRRKKIKLSVSRKWRFIFTILVCLMMLMTSHSHVYPFEIPKRYKEETGWLKIKSNDKYVAQKNFANSIIAVKKSLTKVSKLKKVTKKGDWSTEFATEIRTVLDLRESIATADKALRNEFAKTEKRCIDAGFSDVILERHHKMVANYERSIGTLLGYFDILDKSTGEGKMGLTLDTIEKIKDNLERHPVRKDPPLLSSDSSNALEQKVKSHKEWKESDIFQFTSQIAQDSRIYLAYDQSKDGSGSSYESTSSLDLPSAGDLTSSFGAQITSEIEDLAASLDNSPLKIFEHLRNNFDFELYRGSWKGSQQTHLQGSGNDYDLASLLIALLRASGIPARYVRGAVTIPLDRAMNWMGAESVDALTELVFMSGLGQVSVSSETVSLTHVWVQAYIPYTNYRGIPSDQTGKMWVSMDPSFKQYTYHPGVDVVSEMSFDAEKFVDDYISTFHELSPLELFQKEIGNFLTLNYPELSYEDILRTRKIIPESIGFIPGSLPFDVDKIDAVFSEIDADDIYKVNIIIYGPWPIIDYTVTIPEILGKRIAVSWIASTQDDQDVIDSYGGLYHTPPYLVQLKPVLKINGDVVAVGTDGVGMGSTIAWQFFFTPPVGAYDSWPWDGIYNEIIVGSSQALAISSQKIDPEILAPGLEIPDKDIWTGQILWHTAMSYLDMLAISDSEAAKIMGMVHLPDISEAIVQDAILVTYTYGWGPPLTFEWKGLIVDVDHGGSRPISVHGDKSREMTFRSLMGANASILENRVFEDLYDAEAVSTIKILELASDMDIPICRISTSTEADCPSLDVSENVRNAINWDLYDGRVITIPEREITYLEWTGTGYISMDPETRKAGYFISGSHNGGGTAGGGGGGGGGSGPPGPPPCL